MKYWVVAVTGSYSSAMTFYRKFVSEDQELATLRLGELKAERSGEYRLYEVQGETMNTYEFRRLA